MRSAITIEIPIVTRVWRRSCPSIQRKIVTCRMMPTMATAANATTKLNIHEPVHSVISYPT